MKAIVNGRIVLPDGVTHGMALLFAEKIIGIVRPDEIARDAQRIDARGNFVLPGLIDLHIHGYQGHDASNGDYEGLRQIARGIAKNGVTGFLPTTMTLPYGAVEAALQQIRLAMAGSADADWSGARVLGANIEGPFINVRRKGAHVEEYIRPADAAFIKRYADVAKLITIAPEVPGSMDCIRELVSDTGIVVSMGHTDATYAQAREAFDAGVRHATHLFSAMSPLNHREPGATGAALTDGRVYCELIADTFHVNPVLYEMIAKLKGDRLILISDCLEVAGLPEGTYALGEQSVTVRGIECRLPSGTIAGSVISLNHAVRNMAQNTNLPISDIVNMASLYPARQIGISDRAGSLEAGKDADIAIADKDFQIARTIIGGRDVYVRGDEHAL